MEWIIDKQFDFCYGHRVFNQQLNVEYSLDGCLACRHFHGHQGTIKIFLKAHKLKNGMVTDFKHLNWFKKFIDNYFDHKTIFGIEDPLLDVEEMAFFKLHNLNWRDFLVKVEPFDFWIIDLGKMAAEMMDIADKENYSKEQSDAIIEKYEGLIFVDFVPTSENLCRFFLKCVQKKMKDFADKEEFEIYSIEFWETPKSHCKVIAD